MQQSFLAPKAQPLTLRPYQQQAVDATYQYLRARDGNPCIVAPTGSGKTPIIATICRDAVQQWGGRVIVLAHVKELLQQAADKLQAVCPDVPVGVYSAGLKRRDTQQPILVAGIQSIYSRACELEPFDLALIDEAHLIPTEGEGMYRQFLADAAVVNPNLRVVGLTATPYRMKSGLICAADSILNEVCFEIGVKELIVDGYLSPLTSKQATHATDLSNCRVRGGEFVAEAMESLLDEDEVVKQAVTEVIERTQDRNSVLIFAAGVDHAHHIAKVLQEDHGQECGVITGDTDDRERDRLIERFSGQDNRITGFSNHPDNPVILSNNRLKYLINVNVLTTGFDAPNVDCVVLLRGTLSPGLYYQMVGRGFRLHPGKRDCLVLDFGGNVLRHGPVDRLADRMRERERRKQQGDSGEPPAKQCPECDEVIAAGYQVCPVCGHEFPPPERPPHEATAGDKPVISEPPQVTSWDVQDIIYSVHRKRGASDDAPRTLRVDYVVGLHRYSEWICLEHTGYAHQKAAKWWADRSDEPLPETIEEAVAIADAGGIQAATRIYTIDPDDGSFPRIVDYEFGDDPAASSPKPQASNLDAFGDPVYSDDDIPF